MKSTALAIGLSLALVMPAHAQTTVTNNLKNEVTIGKPVTVTPPRPNPQPPKPQAPKPTQPVTIPATPAKPAVKKVPLATATGGTSNVSTNSSANSSTESSSSSNAAGGAGGEGGSASASAGSVTVNNKGRKREAASAIAPSIYTNSECGKGASGAVQTGVFGLSLGGTSKDVSCEARQNFNAFGAFGMNRAKAAAMCMGDDAQKVAIRAEGVDCELLTDGAVKNKVLAAGTGLDMDRYCNEVIGDWERDADRRRVCANVK